VNDRGYSFLYPLQLNLFHQSIVALKRLRNARTLFAGMFAFAAITMFVPTLRAAAGIGIVNVGRDANVPSDSPAASQQDASLVCASVSASACAPVSPSNGDRHASPSDSIRETASGEGAIKPVRAKGASFASHFALAFRTSTLGLGADVGARLADHVNLRVGFSGFNYSRTVSDGNIPYLGVLRLRSLQALVDWFPGHGGFHLSPGALLYDGNRVTANALFSHGQILSSGTKIFTSDPKDPITGAARSSMRKIAPMILAGFGSVVPRSRRLGISVDFGVVFQGLPSTSFTMLGSACDAKGKNCSKIAADADIQSDVRAGEQTMQNDLSIMKYYPIASVSLGYHF
jgi:hypothetical protein